MKRVVLFLCIVACVVIGTLVFAPMAFRSRIERSIVSYAMRDLNAKVSYDDLSLSFIRSFPLVRISLDNLCVTNTGEWEDDTLTKVGEGRLEMDLMGVLKGDYRVKEMILEDADVRLMINEDGVANWDIVKEKSNEEEKEANDGNADIRIMLDRFEIEGGKLSYIDNRNGTKVRIGHLDSRLEGAWSQEMTDVKTENELHDCDVTKGGVVWLSGGDIDLNAELNADLSNGRYDLRNSFIRLNEIKMGLIGTVARDGEDWVTDIRLSTEEVVMRDLLSLIPALYAKDFDEMRADGKIKMRGSVDGRLNTGKGIGPNFHVSMDVSEGWFKYEKLPKRVEDIEIALCMDGNGTDFDKSRIEVSQARFRMGGNAFSVALKMGRLETLKTIDLLANGCLNFNEMKDYIPLEDNELKGVAKMNVRMKGNYSDYECGAYDRFSFNGSFDLRDGAWKLGDGRQLSIVACRLSTGNGGVSVDDLQLRTGQSDLSAHGNVENLLSWLWNGEVLRGMLLTHSKRLRVEDLTGDGNQDGQGQETSEAEPDVVMLPDGLDIGMTSVIDRLEFEKIEITDARGGFHLANGELKAHDVALKTMGGNVTVDGVYRTYDDTHALLKGKATVSDVKYSEVFRQIESAQKLLPIFGKTEGRFSATIDFDAPLGKNMEPNLNALNASGILESRNLTISGVEALHRLSKVLKRSELYDPEIKDVNIPYEIKDGKVKTGKFSFYIADTKITVDEGTTGLDERIDYMLHVDVPTSESTLFKMSKMGVHIGGTFTQPEVSVKSRDMIEDAKQTLKQNVAKTKESVKNEMKEEWNEQKEEMKESLSEGKEDVKAGLREAKEEIKNAWKGLFK